MHSMLPLLERLGLNSKEAAIYLLLLQTGVSPASTLSRRLDMPSSTAQYTCQRLVKKGLLKMSQRRNMFLYHPEPPKKLLSLLAQQQTELLEKQEATQRIVGELESMMNPHAVMPKVKFFEGLDDVLEAYKELLADAEEGDTIVSYVNRIDMETLPKSTRTFLATLSKDFVRKNISTQILTPFSEEARLAYEEREKNLEEYRFVPDGFFHCAPTEILINKDKMYCMTAENRTYFATIIQNEAIAIMQREVFELAWAKAKEHHEQIVRAFEKKP